MQFQKDLNEMSHYLAIAFEQRSKSWKENILSIQSTAICNIFSYLFQQTSYVHIIRLYVRA